MNTNIFFMKKYIINIYYENKYTLYNDIFTDLQILIFVKFRVIKVSVKSLINDNKPSLNFKLREYTIFKITATLRRF